METDKNTTSTPKQPLDTLVSLLEAAYYALLILEIVSRHPHLFNM
jgi:hypothetical protein